MGIYIFLGLVGSGPSLAARLQLKRQPNTNYSVERAQVIRVWISGLRPKPDNPESYYSLEAWHVAVWSVQLTSIQRVRGIVFSLRWICAGLAGIK